MHLKVGDEEVLIIMLLIYIFVVIKIADNVKSNSNKKGDYTYLENQLDRLEKIVQSDNVQNLRMIVFDVIRKTRVLTLLV